MTRPAQALLVLALVAAGDERLARRRNLGKAFFENPTTQAQAVAEFQKALALQPGSARERLNLGIAYLANGQTAEGMAELERVQKSDPLIPHTWWNLGIQYKKSGDYEKAQRQLEQFVKLVPGEAVGHYNLGALHKLGNRGEQAVKAFEKAAALDPNLAAAHFQLFNLYRQAGRREESAQQLQWFQKAKEGQANAAAPEDVEWSFYSEIYDPAEAAPPGALKAVAVQFSARRLQVAAPGMVLVEAMGKTAVLPYRGVAADVNNDGQADVCAITAQGAELLVNVKGTFESRALGARGEFTHCAALDYDRDYDVDLLLFGPRNVLLRNQGEAGFVERPGEFPFAAGQALSVHVLRVMPDSKSLDLLVSYQDRAAVLYQDRLAGKYEARTIEAIPAGERVWQVADVDADSTIDVLTDTYVLSNRDGLFRRRDRAARGPAVVADFDNRGVAEVHTAPGIPAGQAYAVADFNLDGRADLAVHTREGAIEILTNRTSTPHGWTRVSLTGTKNLKLAPGAEVEVKAGAGYRKQLYEGVPLVFGLAAHKVIDTVRITWPNGLIQNEINAAGNRGLAYKEAQRLSGSCPQVWAWNGREFEYVTDVLGVAPLGAADGDGTYFPTDSREHIQLPRLTARDGYYEVRLTEELAEVAYLDRIRLLTADHAEDTRIYLNERFQAPPYPELEVYAVRDRVAPVPGTLEFPRTPANPLMILRGWTDWADGSMFRHYAQIPGRALEMPLLEYQDGDGGWRVAVENLGVPAGKPKAFAVRVPAARRYRFRSNMDVHWTGVELAAVDERPVHISEFLPAAARLDFRGFSRLTRTRPDLFTYQDPQTESMWNPTPGMYTRYGDVRPLLEKADDQLTLMGSGDELALRFRVAPPPGPGYRRSFVLAVEGWAKDQDPNTAHSQTVEPLPFRGMPSYPYPEGVRHPGGKLNRDYNRRPALRLLRKISD